MYFVYVLYYANTKLGVALAIMLQRNHTTAANNEISFLRTCENRVVE